jgi:hypothetical protein
VLRRPDSRGLTILSPTRGDWTAWERKHIGRLEAFRKSNQGWEIECGRTDTHDPWCVIHDVGSDAIVHIARIGRRYVVAWPEEERSVSFASIEAAVDLVVGEIEPRHSVSPATAT